MTARQTSSLASVDNNVFMIDELQHVPLHAFDILLTDLSAKEISELKIDTHKHLSTVAAGENPHILREITLGENARVLVRACVSKSSSSGPILNVMMLVDTASPYVFSVKKPRRLLVSKSRIFQADRLQPQ
jgi:hypothetical protein